MRLPCFFRSFCSFRSFRSYQFSASLSGLMLSLMLVACGENTTPATSSVTLITSPTQGITSSPTLAQAQAIPATTAPAATTPRPVATAVPLPTTTVRPPTLAPTIPATTAVVATPGNMEGNSSGDGPQRTPNISELPRLNGIVKIPLLNANRPSVQPEPIVKSNYGPNNNPRVGLQIGHFQIDQLPDENSALRGQTGGSGGGVREVDFNQDVTRRVGAILSSKGIAVDILPASVPPSYTADVFLAIHADAAPAGNPSGYKLARSRFSAIPQTDDALVESLYQSYGKFTGMNTDSSITRNMTGYYAFNNRNRFNAISKITPAAIIETGFLTSAADRAVLLNRPDAVAQGIAEGIVRFLQNRPSLEAREKPVKEVPSIEASRDNTPVYGENGGIIAYVSKGQRFEYYERKGDEYRIFVPVLRQPGILRKADVSLTSSPR